MRKNAFLILIIASLSLLSMQFGGSHWHFDNHGQNAGLHGTHIHQADQPGHDHGSERDVSGLEKPGVTWSKLMTQLFSVPSLLLLVLCLAEKLLPIPFLSQKPGRQLRWRPPLRAPPATS